jgi:hypothetical protein
MLDQVVVRPELLDNLHDVELRIVERTESMSLSNRHRQPDSMGYADHFPLLLSLHKRRSRAHGVFSNVEVENESLAIVR